MRRLIVELLACDAGATAAEYALILAIVGTGIAVAAVALGTAISGGLVSASSCIQGTTC
jgi:pilus assembly protein Flp/PilA